MKIKQLLLRPYWRYKAHRVRAAKREMFLRRWDELREKIWREFYKKPRSEKSLQWLERKHRALMRLEY